MSKLVWNEGYFDVLGNSAEVWDQLNKHAEAVVDAARDIAPVETGTYRDSIKIEKKAAEHRLVAVVVADVPYGMVVEGRQGVLNKALRAAGG
jgi:hypothetical protein